ncbi:MAG: nucleotidyltransferase family protein [Chryseobacterium sp.]|nr:MAG: nucleotidyltransferase family protein [Chryseobacterium sp.]
MKAMIFAAGKGTRLRPFTDRHPKALASVNKVTLLERNIRYLQSFGIQEFVINIHHFGPQIIDFLRENDYFGSEIKISDEKDQLLETGGGLLFARRYLAGDESFVVMNADILTDMNLNDLIESHRKSDRLATLAVSDRDSARKLLFDDEDRLQGWLNKTTGEERLAGDKVNLKERAFSGIHCISPRIFDKIERRGTFSIMDAYLDLMDSGEIYGYEHNARLIDVGKPAAVAEAEKYFV